MRKYEDDKNLDGELAKAFDSCRPTPQFSRWRSEHSQAVEMLKTSASRNGRGDATQQAATSHRDQRIITKKIKKRIFTMKRISALAAIIVIAAVVGAALWLMPGNGGATVAWADVQEHFRNARTMTCKETAEVEGLRTKETTMMFMEPGHSRFILEDGMVWIIDNSKNKVLILDPAEKKGATVEGGTTRFLSRFYMMENLRTIRADSEGEESLGTKEIEGQKVVGFLIRKHGRDTTVWANQKTGMPIRIEAEGTRDGGAKSKYALSNIEFDIELDESLFSTDLPKGYTEVDVASQFNTGSLAWHRQQVSRILSARNLDRLGMACILYAYSNNGKWPDSLEQLVGEFKITEKHLINPNENDHKVGYVYIKPSGQQDSAKLLMYERYVQWKDGIYVLMGNGRVKFIADENEFKKLLQEATSSGRSE